MLETFRAHYVSLHVRVSNQAALHLYRDTLGFTVDKIEEKYYADGENAYSMRMELSSLKDGLATLDYMGDGEVTAGQDEGPEVGSEDYKAAEQKKTVEDVKKVRMGKQLGVGELVEKNEAAAAGA